MRQLTRLGILAVLFLPVVASAADLRIESVVPRSATELELVVPDEQDRGEVWPWALAALSWRCAPWEAAIAIEASASPELSSRFDILARLAHHWEGL